MSTCLCAPRLNSVGSVRGSLSMCFLVPVCALGLGWCVSVCAPEGGVPGLLSPWEQSGAQGGGDAPSLSSPILLGTSLGE